MLKELKEVRVLKVRFKGTQVVKGLKDFKVPQEHKVLFRVIQEDKELKEAKGLLVLKVRFKDTLVVKVPKDYKGLKVLKVQYKVHKD